MYHFTNGGLRNIWLENGYTERKTAYGMGVSFSNLDVLVWVAGQAICQKPGRLNGAEFRYIRTTLQYSQKSLGELFDNTEQDVAKWEKYGKVPKLADAGLRLVFLEHDRCGGKPAGMTETLHLLEQNVPVKIILSSQKTKWTYAIERDEVDADTMPVLVNQA